MRLIDLDHYAKHLADVQLSCEGDLWYGIELAFEALYNEPTIEVPTWIPVTERLPHKEWEARREGTDYYAVLVSKTMYTHINGHWAKEQIVEKSWYDGEGFIDLANIDISLSITHWMPLPTPPKDGE